DVPAVRRDGLHARGDRGDSSDSRRHVQEPAGGRAPPPRADSLPLAPVSFTPELQSYIDEHTGSSRTAIPERRSSAAPSRLRGVRPWDGFVPRLDGPLSERRRYCRELRQNPASTAVAHGGTRHAEQPRVEMRYHGDSPVKSMLTLAYQDSYARLRTTASRYVAWQDADDMVQDAFVRALQAGSRFRADASPLTWLHRIVVNTCLDEGRRGRRRDRIAAAVAASGKSAVARPHSIEHLGMRTAFRRLAAVDRA